MVRDKLKSIRNAGIIGAGGAGFPTHVKLGAKVEYVIANGAECEPLLRGDRQLCENKPHEILKGLRIAMELTGAKTGIIGIKRKYIKAVGSLKTAINELNEKEIELYPLDNFYPAGDEQVLVYEILGRVVPEGGIPLDVGVVVDNVGTLAQITQAVEGTPVTHRWVTVTGAVREPQTRYLPVGMSVSEAIKMAGGPTVDAYSVISGGPMMGTLLPSTEVPIMKTTSGLIVLPDENYVIRTMKRPLNVNVRYAIAACIQCRQCTDICPRYTLGHRVFPDKVMKGVAYGTISKVEHMTTAFLCVECGLCSHYGCPMGLDPKGFMAKVKGDLALAGIKNSHNEKKPEPNEYRYLRQVPLKRLIARLDLDEYDVDAPMNDAKVEVKVVNIPLKQHIGAPSIPVVKNGDRVRRGQLIAVIPEKALGANYHASIDGVVTEIDDSITIESDSE